MFLHESGPPDIEAMSAWPKQCNGITLEDEILEDEGLCRIVATIVSDHVDMSRILWYQYSLVMDVVFRSRWFSVVSCLFVDFERLVLDSRMACSISSLWCPLTRVVLHLTLLLYLFFKW